MEATDWAAANWASMSADERSPVAATLILLLAPFAPHLAEELWERSGHPYSVHQQRWPAYRPDALAVSKINLVVQVDGKVRARIAAPAGLTQAEALKMALDQTSVSNQLRERSPAQVVYVPDKLINLVT